MGKRLQPINLVEIDEILTKLEVTFISREKLNQLKELRNRYEKIVQILKNKKSIIRKLQKIVFGSSSEKTSKLIKKSSKNNLKKSSGTDQQGIDDKDKNQDSTDTDSEDTSSSKEENTGKKKPKGGKPKGSGRLSASDYPGAEQILLNHPELKSGDECPKCVRGSLNERKDRAPSLFLFAQAPIFALMFLLQVLRCSNCGREFRPQLPKKATQKYDPSVAAMLAMLRYLLGFPHTRIEKLQAAFGIPIPTSTQWDILKVYKPGLKTIFEHLVKEAAFGNLMHCDDTNMLVLELFKQIQLEKVQDPKARTGIFTTNIISRLDNYDIVLYWTGRHHAGENMEKVLSLRDKSLQEILQMCDGLEHNSPANISVILCNCLTHGRRKFVDIIFDFPDEVQRVLNDIKQVYINDDITKKQDMTPEQRLAYHQEHSKQILDDLKSWFEKLKKEKLVEPNSGLGKAIEYMLKRWESLTRFLQIPGAPIDNNIAERALKMAILHRKNSLYYRSEAGAQFGDYIMSLGNTCFLNNINPYGYLAALFTHIDKAESEPRLWMPWNYEQRLNEIESESKRQHPEQQSEMNPSGVDKAIPASESENQVDDAEQGKSLVASSGLSLENAVSKENIPSDGDKNHRFKKGTSISNRTKPGSIYVGNVRSQILQSVPYHTSGPSP